MKKIILISLINLFIISNLIAQNAQIKGVVIDNISDVKLANTSISLLRQKDSILVSFTRAKTDGSFGFNNIKEGKYFLLFSYPAYADYVEPFTIDEKNPTKDFKQTNLLLKARLLQEVIFKGEAVAIRMKGDTTEFNAGSFKVQPNAKVEDLLKQLPGIQIDKDGKITAQGQTVTRVLVDGEEFFGDDPTLVTKNLRSDMVDKVQLYDDKSENAKFTGIDDGVKNKTINLKLKEDKKKGYFGKLIYDIRRRMSINKQSLLSLNKFQMEKEVLLRNNRIGTHKKILEKISHHPMSLINPKKTYPDQQICFLTYGDHKFARSKQRICNEAKRLGLFDKIIIKSKNDLLVESSEFKKKLKSNPRLQKIFAAPRGGGYWIWKPFVILEQLRKMDENDVLIYTDAGCTVPVGNDGKKQQTKEKLQEYISVVNQSEKGVLAFKNPHIDHVWTTGDIFRYFKTFDDPKVYNTRQFSGGRLHVIRKCNHSMKLYERWWEITHTKPNFYTDNPSSTQNFPRFVENRHDQSVFSILCKVHGVEEEYSWDKIPIKATHIHG